MLTLLHLPPSPLNLGFDMPPPHLTSYSAARGGADRLELCANLGLGGGTTPGVGLLKAVQRTTDMPIMVWIVGLICFVVFEHSRS